MKILVGQDVGALENKYKMVYEVGFLIILEFYLETDF